MYNDPQGGWGNYVAEVGGSIIPYPVRHHDEPDHPQVNEGMSFLTKDLTNDHVIAPGSLSGPNDNGNNLQQVFAQGQVAMWETGDWNTLTIKPSVTFPVGVAMLPIGPDGRVSVFNGLIDGLNSHTQYPKQAWELEQWLGSPQSRSDPRLGRLRLAGHQEPRPAFPALLAEAGRRHVRVPCRGAREGGQLPGQPGHDDALTDIDNDLGPAFFGTESVSQALKTAQIDGDYVLRTS